eukprot:PLAT3287.32.p2 GENE.PLAT3287.32~~PLAT3287.32.p2  ORF type:complete len:1011 (-),score=581.16 PLAT3287.32:1690-4506(-)
MDLASASSPDLLAPGLRENFDYVLLNERVWQLLSGWYGGGPAFPRAVIERGVDIVQLQVELYPIVFTVFAAGEDGEAEEGSRREIGVSRTKTFTDAVAAVRGAFEVADGTQSRLWFKLGGEGDWQLVPEEQDLAEADGADLHLLLEVAAADGSWTRESPKSVEEWRAELKVGDLIDAQDSEKKWYESLVVAVEETTYKVHFKGWSSKWDASIAKDSPRLLPVYTKVPRWREFRVKDKVEGKHPDSAKGRWYEATVMEVNEEEKKVQVKFSTKTESEWLPFDSERLCRMGTHIKARKRQTYSYSNYSSYYGGSSFRRSNTRGSPLAKGIVGLHNLGNTCFMNSMLQCLSHCGPLTSYFLDDSYVAEINKTNVLGMGGRLAEAYAALLKEIWGGEFATVVPSTFKTTIGKFAPQFSGYQQQDSQELMNFLLDGLHEDLNRVLDKPYTETVESGGRPDAVVAADAWDTHLLRNRSIVVDIFTGQLKSHVVCPCCPKESTTFDPFISLSVPLPIETDRLLVLVLYRRDGDAAPVRHCAKVDKSAPLSEVIAFLSSASGLPAENIVLGDVFGSRIFQLLSPQKRVADVRPRDEVVAYEVLRDADIDAAAAAAAAEEAEAAAAAAATPAAAAHARRRAAADRLVIHTQLMHRRMEKNPYYRPGSTYHREFKGVLFGKPRVLSIPRTQTWKELHDQVWAAASRMLSAGHPFSRDEPPYRLSLSNASGTLISKDALPETDEVLALRSTDAIVIDWDKAALAEHYDQDSSDAAEDHASMKAVGAAALAGGSSLHLLDCIAKFTEKETLSAADLWYCPDCKDHVAATKEFTLWKLPEVLVIHLKRFQYSQGTLFVYRDKLDQLVQFPLQGLDLTERELGSDEPAIYDCFAVSNHSGGLGGGHYTAYVKGEETAKWYNMNDSSVSLASEDAVVSSKAYVLFYRRRMAPA